MRSYHDLKIRQTELCTLFGVSKQAAHKWKKDGLIDPKVENPSTPRNFYYDFQDIINVRKRRGLPEGFTKKTQVFCNVKGGVGKSTLSAQYLMHASMIGLKCLAIDLDPQGHLTHQLGFDTAEKGKIKTIHNILIEKEPIESVIQEISPTLHIIPSTLDLSLTESHLFQEKKREFRLQEALSKIKDQYDLVVADTNPSISVLNLSMHLASDEICIVCSTDFLSFHGLKLMFEQIEDLKEDFGIDPKVRVIPNLFDVRDGICQESLGAIRTNYSPYITNTVVRKNTDLREASKMQNSIWFVKKGSSGREDIQSLTKEILI